MPARLFWYISERLNPNLTWSSSGTGRATAEKSSVGAVEAIGKGGDRCLRDDRERERKRSEENCDFDFGGERKKKNGSEEREGIGREIFIISFVSNYPCDFPRERLGRGGTAN